MGGKEVVSMIPIPHLLREMNRLRYVEFSCPLCNQVMRARVRTGGTTERHRARTQFSTHVRKKHKVLPREQSLMADALVLVYHGDGV